MKKFFTRILAVVCCLAASISVNAQFSKVFEQYPRTDYKTDAVNWSLTEIATVLETDTATLVAALSNFSAEMFYLEGDEEASFNCTPNGYWMNLEAVKTPWGDDAYWYVNAAWNQKDDIFAIEVGQYPNHFKGGEETAIAHLGLAFNGKKATFDIALKVLKLDLPEATNLRSKLTIVEHRSVVVEQWAKYSKATTDTLDFKGIAAALGTTPALFSVAIGNMAYTTKADEGENMDTYGFMTDTLTNASTSSSVPGWWYANPFDGYDEFVSVSSTQGVFYADAFAFNSETEELTFDVGQKSGELPIILEGQDPINQAMCKVYFIYGDKAVELSITLKIVERDVVPFTEMTEVGSETVKLSQYPTSSYETVSFSLDIDAISTLLEVDAAEITLWAPTEDGDITDDYSLNQGEEGFWFSKDGYRSTWSPSCGLYVRAPTNGDYSTFITAQYPDVFQGGDTGIATLYLVAGAKYYTVHIEMEIKAKEGPAVTYESVAERAVNIQVVPASVYPIDMRYDIDPAELEALIGTTAPTLYARKAPAEGSEWVDELDDRYSCDPKPGFWMSTEGYRSTWGTSGTNWGFSYLNESSSDLNKEGVHQFEFFQMPNTSQVGDEYNAVVYLANDETGKMISYNMSIKFVSTVIPPAEVVGTQTLWLPVKAGLHTYTTVDFSDVVEKLELEDARQLEAINSLCVLMEDGTMSEPMATSSEAPITDKGCLDMTEKFTEAHVNIIFNVTETNQMAFDVEEWLNQWDNDTRIVTKIGFQKENKIYIFNITFVSEEVYTRIAEAKANASKAVIFDLSGRRVEKTGRGVYIMNGKKMVK